MKSLHRPATLLTGAEELDREMRAARWTHHRLLDFEDQHQQLLDRVSDECAPGIQRTGLLLAKLGRRKRWAERASEGRWKPRHRPELEAALRKRLAELRKQRNTDPRWKEALGWADGCDPNAPERGKARRKKDETDEQYVERCSKRRNKLTRREAYRSQLYKEREIYWGTWNALIAAVDQARQTVLQQRKQGLQAEWSRPRWDDSNTLTADGGGFRIIERGHLWWIIEQRTHHGWVRYKAKGGNWHPLDGSEKLKTCKLTRRKNGRGWSHSVSIAIEGAPENRAGFASDGKVALDWGHREHGHSRAQEGLRVFTWVGEDGRTGEILLPVECRKLLDRINETKAHLDNVWNKRRETLDLPQRSRYTYRSHLMLSGVRTAEESKWLRWETRHERRLMSVRKRIKNLRRETYLKAVRGLRQHYATFVLEDEHSWSHRKQAQDEMSPRRKRQNRELSARYEFVQICERLGAHVETVTARNSTRECPDCGHLDENGPELEMACGGCGRVRDKDFGAARVILARFLGPLENQAAE